MAEPVPGGRDGAEVAASGVPPVPKYQPGPPERRPLTRTELLEGARRLWRTFAHLLRHTLSFFGDGPVTPPLEIALNAPAGKICDKELVICQHIEEKSAARLQTLEQKSTTLLSIIAIVAPLTASAAVFIKKQPLPTWAAALTLVLELLGALAVLLAFVAVLRALAVRGHQELYLDTIIDRSTDAIRPYNDDFYGRGLLWTAANRQAVCDHIADFVRAAQVFLVLGVALAVLAAVPVLSAVRDDTQQIAGTVRLDPRTIAEVRALLDAALADPSARVADMERKLDSLRTQPRDTTDSLQIAALSRDVAALRLEIAALRRRLTGSE